MIEQIDIRRIHPEGPHILGELIASCPVIGVDTSYSHPQIDIKLPPGFALPDLFIDVALYADNRYMGRLILGPDGFLADSHAPYTSPYFTIEIAPLLAPSLPGDQVQRPRFR